MKKLARQLAYTHVSPQPPHPEETWESCFVTYVANWVCVTQIIPWRSERTSAPKLWSEREILTSSERLGDPSNEPGSVSDPGVTLRLHVPDAVAAAEAATRLLPNLEEQKGNSYSRGFKPVLCVCACPGPHRQLGDACRPFLRNFCEWIT